MTNTATIAPGEQTAHGDAVVDELVEIQRALASLHAQRAAVLARAVDVVRAQSELPGPSDVRDIPLQSMAAQIGAALRVSDRTVQRHLSDAIVLTERFPATCAALAAGEVAPGHVRVIVEAGLPIDDDAARAAYEAAVLEVARRETPGRLKPAARMLAARLHPVPPAERHAAAARARCVWVRDLDDGMAELIATLPAHLAYAIRDRVDQYSRRVIDARGDGGDEAAVEQTLLDEPAMPDTRGNRRGPRGRVRRPAPHRPRHPGGLECVDPGGGGDRRARADHHPGADRARCGRRAGGTDRARADRHPHRAAARGHGDRVGSGADPPGHRNGAGGGPVPAVGSAEADPAGAGRALPVPRLPDPHPPVRHRPHHRQRTRRTHRADEPRAPVPAAPHPQTPLRVAGQTDPRRGPPLDQPHRKGTPRPPRTHPRLPPRRGHGHGHGHGRPWRHCRRTVLIPRRATSPAACTSGVGGDRIRLAM